MKYSFYTTVMKVFNHHQVVRVDKSSTPGADPVAHTEDRGWFVHLNGSYEAIYLGESAPAMKAGDRVRVTIELCPLPGPAGPG